VDEAIRLDRSRTTARPSTGEGGPAAGRWPGRCSRRPLERTAACADARTLRPARTYADPARRPTETAFADAYRWGRQIHEARSALRHTQSQLRSPCDGLAQTDTAMATVTAELVLPNVPAERRAVLAM
jgi:hypothetical protein